MKIHIDFETRSECDLKVCGADVYSRHPSTEVLCMAYSIDENDIQLWTPEDQGGTPFQVFLYHVANEKDVTLIGHNIGLFEVYIWNNVCVPKYGWPPITAEQCEDTMSMAYTMGLPGSLEEAALAAGVPIKKDMSGRRIMLQLSQPRTVNPTKWWTLEDVPEKFIQLYEYCKTDVAVERELYKRLVKITGREREVWELDQKINQRGVNVDLVAVKGAIKIAASEQERLSKKLSSLTGNMVCGANENARFKTWLKSQGVDAESIAKAALADLLKTDLPGVVREALLLRQEAGKSSVAKYTAMEASCFGGDTRMRGLFSYHGATTGRWAGRRTQLQNLPRPLMKPEDIEDAISFFNTGDATSLSMIYGNPLQVLSDTIRGMLIPSAGKKFVSADFSNIEGRGLAWLAGEEWKLKAFRDFDADPKTFPDIYVMAYAKAFGIHHSKVTKDQRQIGKVMELALGYGGGKGAFQKMAAGYGVIVSESRSDELKNLWREAHPKTVSYWYEVERAAIKAVNTPGGSFAAGPKERQVIYKKSGSFLTCRLPSNRFLYYPYPAIEEVMTPWGQLKNALTYKTVDAKTKKWQRVSSHGGVLVENITQAVARDVLSEAMLRLEKAGYEVVAHVHDEIIAEHKAPDLKRFESIMGQSTPWSTDFPVVAKGWVANRFKKD